MKNISTTDVKKSSEIEIIFSNLLKKIPDSVDGKSAILEMRDGGSPNWRQMEWIGFWFEYFVKFQIIPEIGGGVGPTFGSTTFDFQRDYVWDLKAHPNNSDLMILNDKKSVLDCVYENGGMGFIIVLGETKLDDDSQTFKNWHDKLKGGKSKYEEERIKRKAPSRVRKIKFNPTKLFSFWISGGSEIEKGLENGWLKPFQENMRNSNGKPRPAKLSVKLSKIPRDLILFDKVIKFSKLI